MKNTDATNWLLVVEDRDEQWTFLRGALRGILPDVYTVHAHNVITALSYLQACLLEKRPLPRLILSDLYLPLRQEGYHLVGTIESPSLSPAHLQLLAMNASATSAHQQTISQPGAASVVKPSAFTEWGAFLAHIQTSWYGATER